VAVPSLDRTAVERAADARAHERRRAGHRRAGAGDRRYPNHGGGGHVVLSREGARHVRVRRLGAAGQAGVTASQPDLRHRRRSAGDRGGAADPDGGAVSGGRAIVTNDPAVGSFRVLIPYLLASEPSAYLKSAAHQPVHWHPWGEAALQRARAEDKPILLDTRAASPHRPHATPAEPHHD